MRAASTAFARDMEHALVEQSGDSVTLCLEANVLTMEKFPFAFKLFSTFRLEGVTVHHDIRVENDGGEVMPFRLRVPSRVSVPVRRGA
ncbi:MAG: hypothetical protein ACLRZH_02070 [Ruthenibacterium lactatiformans]